MPNKDRDIEEILEGKAEKFRERVEENVGKFREKVDDARERFEDMADSARARGEEYLKKGEDSWKDVSKFTQKHPAKALGIAALVGAALGLILFGGGRRND